jgi:hypothetical protein
MYLKISNICTMRNKGLELVCIDFLKVVPGVVSHTPWAFSFYD